MKMKTYDFLLNSLENNYCLIRCAEKRLGQDHQDAEAYSAAEQATRRALERMISEPKMQAVLKIQDVILEAVQLFFRRNGFREIVSPILALETDPGIRGAGTAMTEIHNTKLKLTTSMNIQKFAAAAAFKKIFSISPVIRVEKLESVNTRRHLIEFRILEMEIAYANLEDLLAICESFVCFVFGHIKNNCYAELSLLGRQIVTPKKPFERISFEEARKILASHSVKIPQHDEIPWKEEELLSRIFKDCFWITHFPNGSRGFYNRVCPDAPNYLLDMDLMYPEGYGEACSGGEREYTFEGIKRQLLGTGCNLSDFKGILQLSKGLLVPSAGCGFGLERLTRYICGLDSIWDAVPYPKVPGSYSR